MMDASHLSVKSLLKLGKTNRGVVVNLCLIFSKLLFASPLPLKMSFLHALGDRCHESTKITDKTTIKGSKSMKMSNITNSFKHMPITNSPYFLLIHTNSISSNNKTQK